MPQRFQIVDFTNLFVVGDSKPKHVLHDTGSNIQQKQPFQRLRHQDTSKISKKGSSKQFQTSTNVIQKPYKMSNSPI